MLIAAEHNYFYCRVSLKNIYICIVYTIFGDYTFPRLAGIVSINKKNNLCT